MVGVPEHFEVGAPADKEGSMKYTSRQKGGSKTEREEEVTENVSRQQGRRRSLKSRVTETCFKKREEGSLKQALRQASGQREEGSLKHTKREEEGRVA